MYLISKVVKPMLHSENLEDDGKTTNILDEPLDISINRSDFFTITKGAQFHGCLCNI